MTTAFDFKVFPVITTERLILRQFTHADAAEMIALFGSPDVLRFLNMAPVDTRQKAIDMIDWFNGDFARQAGAHWAITRTGADGVIGHCGFYAWERAHRRVDIGYHILPAYWGHGCATEAAQAVVDWCFASMGLHRIQADCTAGNDASERVMIKCGFTLEGVWRESCWEHGRFVDIRQYGLLAREHAARRGLPTADGSV
ncbi:MAG: GNAT family N-acetyltransferase [Chloroflexota bacterium]